MDFKQDKKHCRIKMIHTTVLIILWYILQQMVQMPKDNFYFVIIFLKLLLNDSFPLFRGLWHCTKNYSDSFPNNISYSRMLTNGDANQQIKFIGKTQFSY